MAGACKDTLRPRFLTGSMSANAPAGVKSTGTTGESPATTTPDIDWNGPFLEFGADNEPTGYTYVQCPACSVEVLTNSRRHATHREGCPRR